MFSSRISLNREHGGVSGEKDLLRKETGLSAWKKGEPAPEFCLPDQEGTRTCLNDFKGQWVVLYFYPKDNTPGCTLEAVQFIKIRHAFESLDAVILGISPDSAQSHCRFIEKHELVLRLLSDPGHEVLQKYGVWIRKKMMGKVFWGVERSTFLIDPSGTFAHIWKNVRAQGHAEEVLETLKNSR